MYTFRQKQLREGVWDTIKNTLTPGGGMQSTITNQDLAKMSRSEMDARINAYNTINKERENEGFLTKVNRTFGMNPRTSQEAGQAQQVIDAPAGSLPTGKLSNLQQPTKEQNQQINDTLKQAGALPTPVSQNTQLNQQNVSTVANKMQGNQPTAQSAPVPTQGSLSTPGSTVKPTQQTQFKSVEAPTNTSPVPPANTNQPNPNLSKLGSGEETLGLEKPNTDYFNKLNTTVDNFSKSIQSSYRPGFSNTPNPQEQKQQQEQQRNAQFQAAEKARQARNRGAGGMNVGGQMQQGMQIASSAGINPMGAVMGGGLNPTPTYIPNRQVGYGMNVNTGGFRMSRATI